jgi:outer membrane protein assembly factor BamB
MPDQTGTWSGAAIGPDGTVYTALCETNGGTVYAFEASTGKVRWQFHASCFNSTPAVGADGTVYVAGEDGRACAFEPTTGTVVWSFQSGSAFDASPAIGQDGTVYIGCTDKNLYALDGVTGAKRWEFSTGGALHEAPALAVDGTVYTGSTDGSFYAVDSATGSKKWAFQTGGPISCSPAIGDDGTVYFGSGDHTAYALNGATGNKRWQFSTTGPITWSPTVSDDMVLIGSDDGVMYSFEADTGETCWFLPFTIAVSHEHPVEGADGNIYFGDSTWIFAIDHITKDSPWSFTTQGVHNYSPIVGADGTIFFGSDNGPFYAVWSASLGALANSPWPAPGQNVRRTGQAPTGPVILNQPSGQIVRLGNQVLLSAITSGAPPVSFQWMLNHKVLLNATNAALVLSNVQSNMLGAYQLLVSNRFGAATSSVANITLTAPAPPALRIQSGGQLTLNGSAGQAYRIEFTHDLGARSWVLLTNLTLTTPSAAIPPAPPANLPSTFYRALTSSQ